MPFREDLDLSGVVDKFEVFGGKSLTPALPLGPPPPEPGTGEDPGLAGWGPIRVSTSRVLTSRKPLWAWDPNRYYRDLGIPWPYVHVTKKDLRMAYMALEGQTSERLTYCFKQLLVHREAYDALALGHLFMDDIYVQAEIKRRITAEAERLRITPDELLDRRGFVRIEEEEETGPPVLDKESLGDKALQHESVGPQWHYAFYLWKTTEWEPSLLCDWQAALIQAIDQRVPTLTVGIMGGRSPVAYAIQKIDEDWVVFIHADREPTLELAQHAATALLQLISRATRELT